MSSSPDLIASTDNELLMQFVHHRDEQAFRQLVERHAGLLMNVCRRVTRNEQDAEDAFQATLLILVRRADRLLHVTSLGGWLQRVAFRTALRAGAKPSTQRESRLIEDPVVDEVDALRDIHARELQRVLHEELSCIAARYRNAIVLCDLEGKTRFEAAEQLDCTEAAVKAALARGRSRLRFRMLKRGTLLSLGVITANKAIAAIRVSPELFQNAVALGFRQIQTSKPAPNMSDSVQRLVREGLQVMNYSALMKLLTFVCVAFGLLAIPIVLLGFSSSTHPSDVESVTIGQLANDTATHPNVFQAADSDVPNRLKTPNPEEPDQTESDANRVDDLTSELLETLRQLVDATEARFQGGKVEPETVFRAREKLYEVQLDLARTRLERTRILEERVQNLRELEKIAEASRDLRGSQSRIQLFTVKAERLKAQIALLKDRTLADAKSEARGESQD